MISRNLSLRIMTGLPLAAVAIWFFFLANRSFFIGISILIGIISYYEYGKALQHKSIPIKMLILYLSQFTVYSGFWFLLQHNIKIAAAHLVFVGLLIIAGSVMKHARAHKLFIWYLLPIFWISTPLSLLYLLRFELVSDMGSLFIFFIILVAAFNDIFAFFGGKQFGKHPLAPTISPKKTIEGSIFGIIGGLLAGLILSSIWMSDLFPLWKSVPLIIILVIASQGGDLFESKFKRFCGIKDSSDLIPGHGGLLDRIDAYLLALPTFIGLLYIFKVI